MKEIICLEKAAECIASFKEGGLLEELTQHLRRGALVVYPTETLYGLGGDPFNKETIERVYKLKRRPHDMGLAVGVARTEDFELVSDVPEWAWTLIDQLEAASVAFLLPKRSDVPTSLTGGRANVVVRAMHHPLAIALTEAGGPIISTSANLHGHEPPRTMEEAREQLGDGVDYYIDSGRAPQQSPSTIIEPLPDGDIRILREGVVTSDWLDSMLSG
jgi:L-threonylcarbamoyladenylate synthase